MCVNALLFALEQKSHVGKVLVANPGLQISAQRRRRKLSVVLLLSQHKVIKVIKSLNSIVAAEDIQAIFDHLPSMAEPGRWCLNQALFGV